MLKSSTAEQFGAHGGLRHATHSRVSMNVIVLHHQPVRDVIVDVEQQVAVIQHVPVQVDVADIAPLEMQPAQLIVKKYVPGHLHILHGMPGVAERFMPWL